MILDQIAKQKQGELEALRAREPLAAVRSRASEAPPPLDFRGALAAGPDVAVIAEIKRKSPSAGLIRKEFDPAAIARAYCAGGAAALSVLTDEVFFGGRLEYLAEAKNASGLPVLRKDFIIDPYQVFEARAAGADAVLLIVRMLHPAELAGLLGLAGELGMAALVETHSESELEQALDAGAEIVGINNRDLDSLSIDLATTEVLAPKVPAGRIVVSESGIASRRDVEHLALHGAHAVLVGETLMKSREITGATRDLTGVPRKPRPRL